MVGAVTSNGSAYIDTDEYEYQDQQTDSQASSSNTRVDSLEDILARVQHPTIWTYLESPTSYTDNSPELTLISHFQNHPDFTLFAAEMINCLKAIYFFEQNPEMPLPPTWPQNTGQENTKQQKRLLLYTTLESRLELSIKMGGGAHHGSTLLNLYQYTCLHLKQIYALLQFARNNPLRVPPNSLEAAHTILNNMEEEFDKCGPGLLQKVEFSLNELKNLFFPPDLNTLYRETKTEMVRQYLAAEMKAIFGPKPGMNNFVEVMQRFNNEHVHMVKAWMLHLKNEFDLIDNGIHDIYANQDNYVNEVNQETRDKVLIDVRKLTEPWRITENIASTLLSDARARMNNLNETQQREYDVVKQKVLEPLVKQIGAIPENAIIQTPELEAATFQVQSDPTLLIAELREKLEKTLNNREIGTSTMSMPGRNPPTIHLWGNFGWLETCQRNLRFRDQLTIENAANAVKYRLDVVNRHSKLDELPDLLRALSIPKRAEPAVRSLVANPFECNTLVRLLFIAYHAAPEPDENLRHPRQAPLDNDDVQMHKVTPVELALIASNLVLIEGLRKLIPMRILKSMELEHLMIKFQAYCEINKTNDDTKNILLPMLIPEMDVNTLLSVMAVYKVGYENEILKNYLDTMDAENILLGLEAIDCTDEFVTRLFSSMLPVTSINQNHDSLSNTHFIKATLDELVVACTTVMMTTEKPRKDYLSKLLATQTPTRPRLAQETLQMMLKAVSMMGNDSQIRLAFEAIPNDSTLRRELARDILWLDSPLKPLAAKMAAECKPNLEGTNEKNENLLMHRLQVETSDESMAEVMGINPYGWSPDMVNSQGQGTIVLASKKGFYQTVMRQMTHTHKMHFNLLQQDSDGNWALMYAIDHFLENEDQIVDGPTFNLIRLICKCTRVINGQDLSKPVDYKSSDLVINQANKAGQSALAWMLARPYDEPSEEKMKNATRQLLLHGAIDFELIVNDEKIEAWSLAAKNGHKRTFFFLLRHDRFASDAHFEAIHTVVTKR